MLLDFTSDLGHRAYGFGRIDAERRFAGQHDGVGSVEDCIRHVGGLGAGRARRRDHRLEHLRGRDDRFAGTVALGNDFFLHDRHRLDRNLDAEVAASDHDAVGRRDDAVQLRQGFVLFYFGDYRYALVAFRHESLDAFDVFGRAHERDRDVVDTVLQSKLEELEIALRDRGNIQRTIGVIDSLSGAQVSAELDGRLDLVRALSDDEQSNLAVLQVETFADRDVRGEVAIRRAHPGLRSRHRLGADDEPRAAFQPHGGYAVGQRPRPYLGARQILQERGVQAKLGGDRARALDHQAMLVRRSVGEIQTQHVCARNEERA